MGYHVVAIPYPGRGHINPLLNLFNSLVSDDGILVTFVVTEEWLRLLAAEPRPRCVRFASIPNVLPSETLRAADFPGFIEAVNTKMVAPVDQILDGLESPPNLIIADGCLTWAVKMGNRRDIPVALLWPMSATMLTAMFHFHLLEHNGHFPVDLSERGIERVEYLPGLSSTSLSEILGGFGGNYSYTLSTFREAISFTPKANYLLLSTLHELENLAIESLKSEFSILVHPVGLLLPPLSPAPDNLKPEYTRWLDQRQENSVLYVSLGSFLYVSEEQMGEIVAGLVGSGVSFMLVARSKAKRLREACGEGLVVEWCDQLGVLSHASVGGFLSHCGWNSVKEGILCGVPFLTFPIAADQFLNGKMIVEEWKMGWRLRKETSRDCVVMRDEIAAIARGFMNGEDGRVKDMRNRGRELSLVLRNRIVQSPQSNIIKAFLQRVDLT
ncbi:PREDICTED: UDP-glycosyltransferase 87A1-like [Tarenaya hassleriana]|uniref:UDP-glycosyltransferase 87A1-like n=1 Tax=Tarenaya hassleriana TaxID=28532 RepID=UPI00053C6F61|nr:PREDICTED: UDP-glycosyltransferase 87A1-like [Tarenaya hassleriana]